jgi:hypothetical protein
MVPNAVDRRALHRLKAAAVLTIRRGEAMNSRHAVLE